MAERQHVVLQNRRVRFAFDLGSRITIVRGDSGTGKTTLMRLIENYERFGEGSGISVSSTKALRVLNNSSWETVVRQSRDAILFADGDMGAMRGADFAAAVRGSDNYCVLMTRENLPGLADLAPEIVGIRCDGRDADTGVTRNAFYRLQSVYCG